MTHIYDYAVIGSGLNGLAVAAGLSRETKNIALIESSDFSGGINKAVKVPTGTINNGLRYMPHTTLAEHGLLFLENLLGLKIIMGSHEQAPITYESTGFKTFLGFGDNPPPFYEELNYFTAPKSLELHLEPYAWTQMLFEKFTGTFMPRSYVTKFHTEGERVSHVTVNGSKTIHAQNFIFTGHVRDLALLLPEASLSIRARTKLSKNLYWTGLCVDLCHSHIVSESSAMHVLNGTTQDEIGPSVGQFMTPHLENGETLQMSQWTTFIEQEAAEDAEAIGLALKKIKRQIKRAYPNALDNLKMERIVVAPNLAGNGDLKLNANMTLPHHENLWISSSAVHPQKNLVGALLQADLVLTSLGFKTDTAFVSSPVQVNDYA